MKREDLLALTPDSLAALSNRGLVKRAEREIAAGKGPGLEELADGTVVGRFEGGVEARLAPDTALADCVCSCGAPVICRHRVAVALAYRTWATDESIATEKAPPADWSPGRFSDEDVQKAIGKRAWERAKVIRRKGYVAEVRRPTVNDPVPTVGLATSTVRFLVPGDLRYVVFDGAKGAAEPIALAVWAFREADARDGTRTLLDVEVGGDSEARGEGDPMAPVLALACEVVLEGVAHLDSSVAVSFERARRSVVAAKLAWPMDAAEDLEGQIRAYRDRSAWYSPQATARHVVELFARDRASRNSGELSASRVLGTEEAPETKLDHLRLVSLGARVRGRGNVRRAEVVMVDPEAGTLLVMAKDWEFSEGEVVPTAADLGRRRISGQMTLRDMAHGQIVTETARRRANRLLVLGQNRVARTSLTPSNGDWGDVSEQVRMRDVASLERALDQRPPAMLRPRVLADGVYVLETSAVADIWYSSGDQELVAEVEDVSGGRLRLRLAHNVAAPGALDALAFVLSGGRGEVRYVSGVARRGVGGLEIEPLAVVARDMVVLDLSEDAGRSAARVGGRSGDGGEWLSVLRATSECLERGVHHGLRRASPDYVRELRMHAGSLRALGAPTLASRLRVLAERVEAAQGAGAPELESGAAMAWVNALLRSVLTLELA